MVRRTAGVARSRAVGAVISQGVVAGSSLALQVIASRQLGGEGLGRFSLLLAVLITVNSVQTGWIGDSLTVLDRFELSTRRGLFASQAVALVVMGLLCGGVAALVDDARTGLAFAIAGMLWALEETCRRLLIARRTFWALCVNDLSYAAGALGALLLAAFAGVEMSLFSLVVAMATGSLTAIFVASVQLPRYELAFPSWGEPDLGRVATFGFWRAAQVGLRPASQAIVRALVVLFAGAAALGALEGARLLLAPLLTVANGAGVYLLPTYANAVRERRPFAPRVKVAVFFLAAACAVYTGFAVAVRGRLVPLLTNDTYEVSTVAIIAWGVFAASFAAGIPAGNAVVAAGRSAVAFRLRLVDAGLGLVLAGLLAALSLVELVPMGLGIGAIVGARLLLRAEPSPTDLDDTAGPDGTADTGETRDGADPMTGDDGSTAASAFSSLDQAVRLADERHVAPPAAPVRRDLRRHRPEAPLAGVGAVWWLPLLLLVATDYKFRRRLNDDALSGSLDLFVLLELGVYLAVAAYLAFRATPRVRWYPVVVMTTGYCLATAVSAVYAPFPNLAVARAVQLLIICYLVLSWIAIADIGLVRRFMHAYIVLITVSIAVGLAWVAPTTNNQVGRFTWLYTHSVIASSLMTLSSVMLFGLWLASARMRLSWPRWVYATLLVVHLVSVFRSQTRGSIGAVALACMVMALLWVQGRARRDLLISFGVVAVGTAIVWGGAVVRLVLRGDSAAKLASFNRRTEIWVLAFERFKDRPLHGLGFTAGRGVFFEETGLGGAHNAYINVIVDTGLVGLVFWIGVIGATTMALSRAAVRRRRRGQPIGFDEVTIAGLLVAMLVNGVTTEGLGGAVSGLAIMLFVTGGWATLIEREARRSVVSTRAPLGAGPPIERDRRRLAAPMWPAPLPGGRAPHQPAVRLGPAD